jgi:hypothetical protein
VRSAWVASGWQQTRARSEGVAGCWAKVASGTPAACTEGHALPVKGLTPGTKDVLAIRALGGATGASDGSGAVEPMGL